MTNNFNPSGSYIGQSERFLDEIIKASKVLQPHFYCGSFFTESVLEEPFDHVRVEGSTTLYAVRRCDPVEGLAFYPSIVYGEHSAYPEYRFFYTRHKQRARFEYDPVSKKKVRRQKAGWTYTYYMFPIEALTIATQDKDSFDLILDFVKVVKYLDKKYLDQGLAAL